MSHFNDILDEIYSQIKNESQYNKQFDHLLDKAVELWSDKIADALPGYSAEKNHKDLYKDISYKIWQESNAKETNVIVNQFNIRKVEEKCPFPNNQSPLSKILNSFLKDKLSYRLKLIDKQMIGVNFIVFLGLIITGVGLVVYVLNKSQSNQRATGQIRKDTQTKNTPSTSPILILVVNALKKDILDKIANQGDRIEKGDGEKLYRATSCLWMGRAADKSQKFINYNYEDYRVPKGQESEYDVYLVEIDLQQTNDGFKKDADSLSKRDAFIELSVNSKAVTRSPRLKVSVYQNTNVYG